MSLRAGRFLSLLAALVLLAALTASSAAPAQELGVRWGPVLSQVTPTSAVVAWAMTEPARCRVLCDGREFRSPQHKIFHTVKLDGLAPATDHEYYVEAFAGEKRAATDHFVFRTPPTQMPAWSFLVFGDTRSDHPAHKKVIDAVLRVTPRPWLAINTGDLVSDGRKAELWDMFFRIEEPLVGT
ncbi:MAG: metallophosphoesterase, partial [Armatimonadetes bacterium]|nr:metallophosphoesterase [Armatimonadota bacterium]